MTDYNDGFIDGATWAFGILRDHEDGIRIANYEYITTEWHALCYEGAVLSEHEAGYLDGIHAVIGHLEIPEGDVVDHEEYVIDTDYDLGAILMDALASRD